MNKKRPIVVPKAYDYSYINSGVINERNMTDIPTYTQIGTKGSNSNVGTRGSNSGTRDYNFQEPSSGTLLDDDYTLEPTQESLNELTGIGSGPSDTNSYGQRPSWEFSKPKPLNDGYITYPEVKLNRFDIYDPRSFGYSGTGRRYYDNLSSQYDYDYSDVNAVSFPEVRRTNVDHLGDLSGQSLRSVRTAAISSWLDGTNHARQKLMESFVRRKNATTQGKNRNYHTNQQVTRSGMKASGVPMSV
jgi:hypothetical protein